MTDSLVAETLDGSQFASEVAEGSRRWIIVSAVNFEFCSTAFCRLVLESGSKDLAKRVRFRPFRLYSKRSSPWSLLEIVKNQYYADVRELAVRNGVQFDVTELEFPITESTVTNFVAQVRSGPKADPVGLIVDLSGVPRNLATFLCDSLCELYGKSQDSFSEVVFVETLPLSLTSRLGLGPFSVGSPVCVRHKNLLRLPNAKATLLLFPGSEGFEAMSAIDAVAGHNSSVTFAVDCGERDGLVGANRTLVANQAVVAEAMRIDTNVDVQYYFSPGDSLRVARDIVGRAVRLCGEFPTHSHSLFVAPFGPKWTVLIASLMKREFLLNARSLNNALEVWADTLTIPRSQYVSLYSRGAAAKPVVMRLKGVP